MQIPSQVLIFVASNTQNQIVFQHFTYLAESCTLYMYHHVSSHMHFPILERGTNTTKVMHLIRLLSVMSLNFEVESEGLFTLTRI